jgi:hypothetical protein
MRKAETHYTEMLGLRVLLGLKAYKTRHRQREIRWIEAADYYLYDVVQVKVFKNWRKYAAARIARKARLQSATD